MQKPVAHTRSEVHGLTWDAHGLFSAHDLETLKNNSVSVNHPGGVSFSYQQETGKKLLCIFHFPQDMQLKVLEQDESENELSVQDGQLICMDENTESVEVNECENGVTIVMRNRDGTKETLRATLNSEDCPS